MKVEILSFLYPGRKKNQKLISGGGCLLGTQEYTIGKGGVICQQLISLIVFGDLRNIILIGQLLLISSFVYQVS